MRDVRVVEVDGDVCVDFRLMRRKKRNGRRVNDLARKIISELLENQAVQTHNKVPKSVMRFWTGLEKKDVLRIIRGCAGERVKLHQKL